LTGNISAVNDIKSTSYHSGIERLIAVKNNRTRVIENEEPGNIDDLTSGDAVNYRFQPFWYPADTLAKVFESTIMTDLGQRNHTPNILADAELLQHFTANFSMINATVINQQGLIGRTGRVTQDYNTLKSTTGTLIVHPSTIAARYLCQVPRLKSTGNLLLSVLVADLVLLQALWTITMWIATLVTNRRDGQANWCEGCVGPQKTPIDIMGGGGTALKNVGRNEMISRVGVQDESASDLMANFDSPQLGSR
jgi:hypothetical protein